MTDSNDPKQQQAVQQALAAAEKHLPDGYDYESAVVREDHDIWVVQISPAERVRGHTAQFIITRDDIKIVEMIYLQ